MAKYIKLIKMAKMAKLAKSEFEQGKWQSGKVMAKLWQSFILIITMTFRELYQDCLLCHLYI
jgi:hypothetical protein